MHFQLASTSKVIDMSDSKIIDDLVNQSSELLSLRTILDKVGAYIYSKDLDGKYTYANSLVCELFGEEACDIIGKDDSHFFDLDASNELSVNDRNVMERGVTIQKEEVNVVKETGRTTVYWSVKAPVMDENKEIIGMCGISTDITDRKRLETTLERESEILKTVLNNVDAHIYMKDANHRYVYANPKVEELMATPVEKIIGHTRQEILPDANSHEHIQLDTLVFSTMQKHAAEEEFVDPSGNVRYFWATKVPLRLSGQEDMLIGVSTEVTELHLLREELERQATTDALTGINNRRFFYRAAEQEFVSSSRYDQPTSLLVLDVDSFKKINDTFGHLTGDEVLKALALHCKTVVRACDIVGRIGGEEFAILLPQTDIQRATILAERICRSFEDLVLTQEPAPIAITVSIGVACRTGEDEKIENLFARADSALYEAKRTGRNKVCTQ
jgi:diguanylate cyclase (GGDEF)-like protein/PAS domain S-box-containing protein